MSALTSSIEHIIYEKLSHHFAPSFLSVLNESHMHSVPVNSETHFNVTLVSDEFVSLSKVKRHQSVYKLLASELAGPVHALAIHTHTLAEWEELGHKIVNSPRCLGGSKADPML